MTNAHPILHRLRLPASLGVLLWMFAGGGCDRPAQPPVRDDKPPVAMDKPSAKTTPQTPPRIPSHTPSLARPAPPPAEPTIAPVPHRVTLGGVTLQGEKHLRSHAHGGKPAYIRSIRFTLSAKDKATTVRVKAVELLRSHCRSKRWHRSTPLSMSHLSLDGGEPQATTHVFRIPPGKEHRLEISIQAEPVYQACSLFGLRARFQIGNKEAWVEAPLRVTRRQKIKRR